MPKSLSVLPTGETIISRQIRMFRELGIPKVIVVVGFKCHAIMEANPDVFFRYNPLYYITNTSKSLLRAIEDLDGDVVWANGDVVCDRSVIEDVVNFPGNCVAVQHASCGEEEVKFSLSEHGTVNGISKVLTDARGEAVGVNKVQAQDLPLFIESLRRCRDDDYFEKGIEQILDHTRIWPVDVTDQRCIEVDFAADWEQAKALFARQNLATVA